VVATICCHSRVSGAVCVMKYNVLLVAAGASSSSRGQAMLNTPTFVPCPPFGVSPCGWMETGTAWRSRNDDGTSNVGGLFADATTSGDGVMKKFVVRACSLLVGRSGLA